jgi:hypothetical protein
MRHGRGDDVGMLRLVLSRLCSLGLAQHDRVNGASLCGPKGPLFHRCSADAEQRILRSAALRALGLRQSGRAFSFVTRRLFLSAQAPQKRDQARLFRPALRGWSIAGLSFVPGWRKYAGRGRLCSTDLRHTAEGASTPAREDRALPSHLTKSGQGGSKTQPRAAVPHVYGFWRVRLSWSRYFEPFGDDFC